MKNRKSKGINFLAALLLLVILCAFAEGRVIYVDVGGGGDFTTIQAGIDDANNWDTVLIADGTYTGAGNYNIDFGGKAITVISENGPENAIVDCESIIGRRGFYFHSSEDANSVLSGLTIKRGKIEGTGTGSNAYGGGIYCDGASPTIMNCHIHNNRVLTYPYAWGLNGNPCGGGIACVSNSHVTIINCKVTNNYAVGMPVIEGYPHAYGGGIFCSSDSTLAISNSIITGNESKGGVWVSDASMSGSVACNSYGGGIYISSGSTGSTIENCLIVNNETVFVESEWYEEPNHGTSRGAGICCGSGVGVTIRNCTFSGNFTYPTGVEGRGGAIYGPATAVDNIIWGNLSVNQIQGAINLSYSDIEGGWSGAGSNNIDQDPCFVGGPEGDYYLSQISASQGVTSPCVDAGSDSAFNLGLDPSTTRTDTMVDIGFVDMGYHYQTDCINGPDIDKDGDVDFLDYAYLANQFQTGPNEPNADIWPVCGDGFVDSNDLALLFEHWLEGFPYPNKATNPSPSDEVNGVSPFVVVSWSAGDYALSRDVYFGTDFNDVNDAGFHDPAFMGNQTGTSWDTNDYNNSMLEYLTTYYWRIDEKNQRGRKKGDVWSFTTGGEPNEHLEAWWKFDEGSDVEVYDSADGHNGTLIGDPSWVAGKIGDYALEFDGAGDCVDTNDFDLPNNFTISLWINPASTNDGQCFIGKHSSDGANKFLFGFWHGGYNVRLQTDVYRTGVKTTGWQHLAVVASQKDASHTDVTVYKNGDILWSHTFDDIAGDMSGKAWTIGQEWDSNTRTDFFNGTIDDVRIYNRHLGGEEIELIYLEGAE